MLIESAPRDFIHIFAISDRLLLRAVLFSLFFAEDGSNFLIEILTTVAHEKDLECLFNGDTSSELCIVHEEGYKVVKLTGLEITEVSDASLVHGLKLLPVDVTIEIIIDLPDDELDVRLGWPTTQELEATSDVHGSDLVVVFSLSSVTRAEEVKHAVQLLLLNRGNLNSLQDLCGTGL